jgi:hypothetical protein
MNLHPNIRSQILEALRAGMTMKRAADHVGYALCDIRLQMKSDALFAMEVRQATTEAELKMLKSLQKSMQWQAWKFLLQSLYPDRYYSARKSKKRPTNPEPESDEERLARINVEQQMVLRPILAQMDAKKETEADPDQRGERQVAGREDPA